MLRIDSTNRVDLIDSAMRRSGRTDLKIPILMPDEEARKQIFEVQVKKHRLACTIADFAPFAARTPGYTGGDLELALTTAYRFALRDGATADRREAPHGRARRPHPRRAATSAPSTA